MAGNNGLARDFEMTRLFTRVGRASIATPQSHCPHLNLGSYLLTRSQEVFILSLRHWGHPGVSLMAGRLYPASSLDPRLSSFL
jgi:hypothetical protein